MCEHSRGARTWLPALREDSYNGCSPHEYCRDCGLVKARGTDRAKDRGYFANILGELRRNGLKDVHARLIVRAMGRNELFTDLYGSYLYFQMEKFTQIVGEISGLPVYEVERAAESCA